MWPLKGNSLDRGLVYLGLLMVLNTQQKPNPHQFA